MTKPPTEPTVDPAQPPAKRRRTAMLLGALAGLAVGAVAVAAIYGMKGASRNAAAACSGAVTLARTLAPLATGEVAALATASRALQVPNLTFRDAAGATRTLAEWRGRTVLLNLWATWCVPCRQEMPALDALEQKLGGDKFQVVAINIDTRDPDKPSAFLKEIGITRLGHFADPSARVFQDLKAVGKAFGMPTTMLIDPNGCELGTMAGPAEWASEDALKLLRAAIGG